ncbi:vitamin K epoxide reductase family protein [Pontibacter sp. E15-1]|uniref:vitamin K epoxide reductase family protein n=1 Tax=Pontibacter sp. E15-1 TaxID=2919918 RepID=UPI001F4F31DA|nr:vitamin K epoxide reductase family protein [Pontibacter sp. E15-1]MCJ8167441.1 vitamin K epoxide reductase family protein [Pontibacter sp. E15-1]
MGNKKSVIDKIRKDKSTATENRRDIAALAAAGLVDFSLISLLQMGYFKKLPDLPGKVFDTVKVNTSKDAVLLGLPDGVISLGAYTLTMLLAMAGSRFKKRSRLLNLALGAVLVGQAAGAAQYMYKMAFVQKKVCIYCVTGAAINFAALKPVYTLLKK